MSQNYLSLVIVMCLSLQPIAVYSENAQQLPDAQLRLLLEEKIELASIQVEIKRQESHILELELYTESEAKLRSQKLHLHSLQESLRAVSVQAQRIEQLSQQGVISQQELQEIQHKKQMLESQIAVAESSIEAEEQMRKLADAKLGLLHLNVKLAETKLKHLKNRLEAINKIQREVKVTD